MTIKSATADRIRTTEESLAAGSFELRAADEKTKLRTFRMKAYTGAQFSRWYGQAIIDLAGIDLENFVKLPMLVDHEANPAAVATKAYIDKDEGLILEGYLLNGTPGADYVKNLADQGFPLTASVGVTLKATTQVNADAEYKVNGRTVKGPVEIWSRTKLRETSFITSGPADDATGVEVMSVMAEPVPAVAALSSAEQHAKIRLEVMAEEKAKKDGYVAKLEAAGAKRRWARDRFDDGATIDVAYAEHFKLMRDSQAEALDRNAHAERSGKLDARDKKRAERSISRGFDPDADKKRDAKEQEALEAVGKLVSELKKGGRSGEAKVLEKLALDRAKKATKKLGRSVSPGEKVQNAELNEAYSAWSDRSDEGLYLRSMFPKHQGGHRLLHAIACGLDNGELMAKAKANKLPLSPPYSVAPEVLEQQALALEKNNALVPGMPVEQLAGTWGRDAHSYSVMTVKGYLAALFKPLEDDVGRGWAQRVGITIPSNQEIETYRFLGNPPQIRKWLGMRQTKFMPPFSLQIANESYEGTVDFSVQDFRFDKSGQIMIRMGELGVRCRQHWDILGTQVLLLNPPSYDGNALFATNHTQGGGFTQKNLVTAADITQLSVSNPTNPTPTEAVAAIMGVVQYFFGYQDHTGSPVNGDARQFVVVCPPNLWGPMVTGIRAAKLNYGQDNPLLEQDYSVDVIPNGWLTTGYVGTSGASPTFFVARVDSMFRPIVFQDCTGWEAQMIGVGSEMTTMKDRILYGVKAVRGFGPGEFMHIIQATFS